MAISFPKTWSSGETLTASDTKNNLDAMRDKAQQLSAADVNTASAWIGTHHIMSPSYNPTTNVTTAVSGVYGGRTNGGAFQNMSYVTRWMSDRTGAGSNSTYVNVPLSCIQIDLTAPCTLFIQWYMNHMSPKDGNSIIGTTHLFAYTRSGVSVNGFAHKVPEQPYQYPGPTANTNSPWLDGVYQTNGFNMIRTVGSTGTTNLNYGIGIQAKSSAGQCQQIAWSVSIECFYM